MGELYLINVRLAFTLMLALTTSFSFAETINVVCRLDKGDGTPIPFKFVKNTNGSIEMYRFDKNESRVLSDDPPQKSYLISLEITPSRIIYKTERDGFEYKNMADKTSPLVPSGETRTGTISRVDGTWDEYYFSFGPMTELIGDKSKFQKGKCEPRGVLNFV